MAERATPVSTSVAPAPSERGWGKLLIALLAFLVPPTIPQLRGLFPIEQTAVLLVPALAACALVGWWAGGRAWLAISWIALATLLMAPIHAPQVDIARGMLGMSQADTGTFNNLARGWSLLLAGSFGLVCLFTTVKPFFTRALAALSITLVLATVMCLVGPMTLTQASKNVAEEFARRNAETAVSFDRAMQTPSFQDLVKSIPQLADTPAQIESQASAVADVGRVIFPAMLALQSLAALALAWATYHRFSRARLGPPLHPLREFRFNDQLIWGLIVGLTMSLLPTLESFAVAGRNLLLFFGVLYALRGFGVLTWFTKPGSRGVTLFVIFFVLFAPLLGPLAAAALMMLGVASLALGLGDTWADWRSRARSTP